MESSDDPKGVDTPSGETAHDAAAPRETAQESRASHINPSYEENLSYGEGWSSPGVSATEHTVNSSVVEPSVMVEPPPPAAPGGSGKPPKPPDPPDDEEDGDDEGMARMSFLEHLEELRKRLLLAIGGIGVAF